jgi:hypothetical protein
MKAKKAGIGTIVVLTTAEVANLIFGGVARADLGKVDYWNASWGGMTGQEVAVTEKSPSGEYLRDDQKLKIYGWGYNANPNLHTISPIGIEPNKAYVLEIRFEAESTMPNNVDNFIDICWNGPEGGDPNYTPFDCNERNFFMRQHPDSPRKGTSEADSNVYDLLDLTNYFTENAQIHLPNITSLTPRTPAIYDEWQKIISNYADLAPSVFNGNLPDGKVNWADFAVFANYWKTINHGPTDNWAKGADLNRDGDVNTIDLFLFSEQWLCDPNTIAKAIQFLPKQYLEALNETAQKILDYSGEHQQRLVCRIYHNDNRPLGGIIPQLSQGTYQNSQKPTLNQLLALSNNGNNHLQRHYTTLDDKLPLKNQRTLRLT